MTEKIEIDYTELSQLLREADSFLTLPEAHGLQMGMLCARGYWADDFNCLTKLIAEMDTDLDTVEIQKQFAILEAKAITELTNTDTMCAPLLPGDDEDLSSRLEALVLWCRGFLSGLGLTGVKDENLSNDIAKEGLKDISNIASVDITSEETNEDESNYVELVEYIKAAVETIQIELAQNQNVNRGN